MLSGAEGDDARFDVSLDRVRLNVGKQCDRKPRVFEKPERLLRDRKLGKPRISHEQRPRDAGGTAGVGEFLDATGAEANGGRVAPIGGRCAHGKRPGEGDQTSRRW
jgi:hypothetical protein